MDADEQQRIESLVHEVRRLQLALDVPSGDWDNNVAAARATIISVGTTTLMNPTGKIEDQVFVISTLQRVAYYEPDSGGVQDVAEWCAGQWLHLLQRDRENLAALQGLGQGWLARAQTALARIHRDEGSSSSGLSSGRPGTGSSLNYTSSDDARDAAAAAAEADARVHTADYVEARGMLLPAIEYFSQATTVAERKGLLTGSLLALAAEAYMSLGNVSYSYGNEQYFRQALAFLRRASALPGYTLSPYLENYLNDYGRLID